jgi:hypothetical protein
MSSDNPSILARTSPKGALDREELRIREKEIKRKLPEDALKTSPIKYHKHRIEELKHESEEQLVHKRWLDGEYKQRHLDEKSYRKAQKEANIRVVSLQTAMWGEEKVLREEEEKAGLRPELGPDSEGAFVCTLLALYNDPKISSKRSKTEQSRLRKAAIQSFDSTRGAPRGWLWCPVTQEYFEEHEMAASHIVPRKLDGRIHLRTRCKHSHQHS